MNPKKDSLYELLVLLKDFGDELFDNTNINFRVEGISENFKSITLDMDWKRNLILIFKEAMHNALKHAKCKNVTLRIDVSNHAFSIFLEDDGTGFIPNKSSQGYGMGNMQNRAERLKGELLISSKEEQGTTIQFQSGLKDSKL